MATRRIRRRRTKRNNRKRNSRKRQTGGSIGELMRQYNDRDYISVYDKYVKQNNGLPPTNDTVLHGKIPIESINIQNEPNIKGTGREELYKKGTTREKFRINEIKYERALFIIECAKLNIFPDSAPLNPAPTAPLNSAPLNSGPTAPLN